MKGLRGVWALGFALTIGASVALGQPGGSAVLTPEEITEGWIALFDGETSYGWSSRGDARWGVAGAQLQASDGGVGVLVTNSHFANFVLRLEFWADAEANAGVAVRAPAGGPVTDTNCYVVKINDRHPKWPTGSISGQVAARQRRPTTGRWTPMEVRCEGARIAVTIAGRQVSRLVNRAFTSGPIALTYGGAGTVRFRGIKLLPLGSRALLNGKDLTGWKAVEGTQSVISVTREGWLNVRNGRGDLQTTDAFADFVLQMEIISNGKNLNSGVFFRANPGGFWSGYEVQIRNQWNGENRSDPVDFGTGGIYNRQAARKVVSNDGEWFVLTLVAVGSRMATWVNGYQVTDFVDTRPVDQTNARRGLRTAAGVISIQGHDPTTDLSFRNIRAAEYPRPADGLK